MHCLLNPTNEIVLQNSHFEIKLSLFYTIRKRLQHTPFEEEFINSVNLSSILDELTGCPSRWEPFGGLSSPVWELPWWLSGEESACNTRDEI